MTIRTNNTAETETCGANLAREMLKDPDIPRFVALYGDLGVGKTAFVRGFTSVIAPNATVHSPTFALVNEYRSKNISVFHFDMYRISNEDDLFSIGFYDYLDRMGICLVEWSENIPYALPDDFIRVELKKDNPDNPDSRLLTIEQTGGVL